MILISDDFKPGEGEGGGEGGKGTLPYVAYRVFFSASLPRTGYIILDKSAQNRV